jgi:hypothetical protein
MKRFVLSFLLLASAFVIAQIPPIANPNGSITGYLTGTLTGNTLVVNAPVPGVTATLSSSSLPNPVFTGTTASIGGGALLAGACASGTATIAGATTAMVPATTASTSAAPGVGFSVYAQVTSSNTVTVSVCALVNGTPTASTYLVRVIT